jgi:hypothetical protein
MIGMSDPHDTTNPCSNLDVIKLIEEAAAWGLLHGRLLAIVPDIRAAVLAGERVEWLDYPDLLWEALGISPDDDLPQQFARAIVIAVQTAASSAAREEGERVIKELTEQQLLDLIRTGGGASGGSNSSGRRRRRERAPGAR